MSKFYVLKYTFLDKEASALIHKKKKLGVVEYHVQLLEEPLDEFFISHHVFDAYSPLIYNSAESMNVIHAIHKALHEQIVGGYV